jgi:hypothetical protein
LRKTTVYIVLVVMAGIFMFGCKKGANDPFLSLQSRTARITGVWDLTSADFQKIYNDGGNTETYHFSFDGTQMSRTLDGDGDTFDYSEKITINKDGTFTFEKEEEDLYWKYHIETFSWESGIYKTTVTGVWYFLDGNNALEVKNKERVAFLQQTVKVVDPDGNTNIDDYSGRSNANETIFLLDRLANKEIVTLYDYQETVDSETYEQTGSSTYTRE